LILAAATPGRGQVPAFEALGFTYNFKALPCPIHHMPMTERFDRGGWDDDEEDSDRAVPLTRAQAQALRDSQPSVSVWQVVAAQAATGVAVAGAAWGLSGSGLIGLSALYGAAVVVLPATLLARGVGRLAGSGPAAAAMGFLLWQGVKMVLSLALLLGAVRVVPGLNWPALLVAVAVCLQVNWLALLWRGRAKKNERR
jgi:ATP synthase protein I